ATASGSSSARLVKLEGQFGQSERDSVARLELGAVHPPPVHLDAVGRAEVRDDPAPSVAAQLGVAAGDVGVGDDDLALAASPQQHVVPGQDAAAPIPDEQGARSVACSALLV